MEPLWKVKSFEKQTLWKVSVLSFLPPVVVSSLSCFSSSLSLCLVIGSGQLHDTQCARLDDDEPMIRREQAVEQQQQEAMHDLEGAGDQDIMFGHAGDETIAYSL